MKETEFTVSELNDIRHGLKMTMISLSEINENEDAISYPNLMCITNARLSLRGAEKTLNKEWADTKETNKNE